jgi:hypothetical protein
MKMNKKTRKKQGLFTGFAALMIAAIVLTMLTITLAGCDNGTTSSSGNNGAYDDGGDGGSANTLVITGFSESSECLVIVTTLNPKRVQGIGQGDGTGVIAAGQNSVSWTTQPPDNNYTVILAIPGRGPTDTTYKKATGVRITNGGGMVNYADFVSF